MGVFFFSHSAVILNFSEVMFTAVVSDFQCDDFQNPPETCKRKLRCRLRNSSFYNIMIIIHFYFRYDH